MKLLGKFYKQVAEQYAKILDDEGIEARIGGKTASDAYGTFNTILVNVFVPDEAYERAIGIVKNFESRNQMEVKGDSKKALLQIFLVLALLGLAGWICSLILSHFLGLSKG